MPTTFNYDYVGLYLEKCKRRKAKKAYWMKKGCSESKAESLLYRYGY